MKIVQQSVKVLKMLPCFVANIKERLLLHLDTSKLKAWIHYCSHHENSIKFISSAQFLNDSIKALIILWLL